MLELFFIEENVMPVYTYHCDSCGIQFERTQKFSDAPLTRCPECSKKSLRKVYTPVGIVFKGSGFYSTDNRSASGAMRTESKKNESENSAKTESKSTDSNKSSESSSSESSSSKETSTSSESAKSTTSSVETSKDKSES
jgi:putative FmdB family regulatory protein